MNKITLEELKEKLDYDPDTGLFTWKTLSPYYRSGMIKVGDVAGSLEQLGYIVIGIDGTRHKAHRLAWLFMTGSWPKAQIDHRNRVRTDNRFCNLREATHAENMKNLSLYKSNSSGYRGVHWSKVTGKWQASVRVRGKRIHLGLFTTPEAASLAAIQARQKHYGEFSDNF